MEVGNKHNLNFRRLELDIGHFVVKLLIQSPRSSYVLFQGTKITLMANSNPPKLVMYISINQHSGYLKVESLYWALLERVGII